MLQNFAMRLFTCCVKRRSPPLERMQQSSLFHSCMQVTRSPQHVGCMQQGIYVCTASAHSQQFSCTQQQRNEKFDRVHAEYGGKPYKLQKSVHDGDICCRRHTQKQSSSPEAGVASATR